MLLVGMAGMAPAGEPTAAADAPACVDPFTEEHGAEIDRSFPGHHITAAVHDERTGCTFTFRPAERVTTASVLKVELYAGVLLRAQREGRWLTSSEAAGAWPMITESANPPASAFFSSLGGVPGMTSLNAAFGLTDTRPVSTWGLTVTSAADQIRLLRQVVVGVGGPLEARYRQALLDAMLAVVPSQRWGITAGVPPGWTVAQKNGFADSVCCGWRINSVGYVRPAGGGVGYSIAILSDGWPSQAAGVAAVEWVSKAVAARLALQPYAGFPSRAGFVERVHTDVVGALPTLRELLWLCDAAGWDGSALAPLLDGLLGLDRSGRGDLVARLYAGLLGRTVDPDGLRHWRGVVRGGGPVGLAAGMLSTPEVRAVMGSRDDAAFVAWLYERLLGRAPDPAGSSWWTGTVGQVGRAGVLAAMASTPEAVAHGGSGPVVVQVYDALLHRLPSNAEIEGWDGMSRPALAAAVVGSEEYRGAG